MTTRNRIFPGTVLLAILAFGTITAPLAFADDEVLWPRFSLSLGGFISTSDSTVQADATSTDFGTNINFESDLGVGDSESVLVARLDWLMSRRNELSLSYFSLSRNGQETIDGVIEFEDITFPVGVEVDTVIDQEQIDLAYTFWALRREKAGLGVSLGVVNLGLEASLHASIQAGLLEEELEGEASADAPVPLIGLKGRGLLGRYFILTGELRFLPGVEIEDYDGSAFSASAGFEWRPFRYFGIGAAYDYFDLDVDVEEEDWHGSVSLTTSGIRLMARVMF